MYCIQVVGCENACVDVSLGGLQSCTSGAVE